MSSPSPVLPLRTSRGGAESIGAGLPPVLLSGFRPFFFGATLVAVLLIPAWLLALRGFQISTYWTATSFHAHEMLYGYAAAVIAGFLLTAASNWTGRDVASGRPLAALVGVWAMGRILPLVSVAPPLLIAIVDVAFLPLLAVLIGRAMVATKNRRNYFFVVLLTVLTGGNVLLHLARWGVAVPSDLGRDIALRVVALMILAIGGRVFPMFTRNATGGSPKIRKVPWLDRLAIGTFLCATVIEFAGLGATPSGLLWAVAGFANAARMVTWGVEKARAPLLWVLHAGYFATALSFVLHGGFLLGVMPFASSLHCFTVGGVGLLTLGMMARVSLGHSGRMLAAPPSISLAFGALALAALVRVGTPLLAPQFIAQSWTVSGVLWTVSFGLFLRFGLPVWFRPRVDA